MRYPVFLLIWLKLIFSDSEVAGNNAIGHVTSDSRKKPWERVSPSFLPRAVERIWIGPIDAVTVLRALQHCALIDQGAERPAAQRPVCGTSGLERKFEVRLGGHGSVSNQLTPEIYHPCQSDPITR